uniref:Uncharacterized protein n=1 Tax=Eutreptiella gymnastica TaxID=73025 RepID=A0A7S1IH50_9EUGL
MAHFSFPILALSDPVCPDQAQNGSICLEHFAMNAFFLLRQPFAFHGGQHLLLGICWLADINYRAQEIPVFTAFYTSSGQFAGHLPQVLAYSKHGLRYLQYLQ